MTEKTIEKTEIIPLKTYIAEDGKEFSNEDECITYESKLFFNRYADKYKIKSILIPTFICNDDHCQGVSFYFPQDGNEDELKRLLTFYQNYEIGKRDGMWEIDWNRDLSNVRDSDLEIKIPIELNKGDIYIFYFCWEEYCDSYDYFNNQIISKEIAMAKLKNEIKNLEEVFGINFS